MAGVVLVLGWGLQVRPCGPVVLGPALGRQPSPLASWKFLSTANRKVYMSFHL